VHYKQEQDPKNGSWKFRAIGEGYDSGLVGLATDYGVKVA